jgi:hypothetical protein
MDPRSANWQAAKMSLADGSISPMNPGASPLGRPFTYTEAMATDGDQSVGYGHDFNGSNYFHTCIHWDSNGVATNLVSSQWTTTHCNATSGGQHGGYVESYRSGFQAPANARRAVLWTRTTGTSVQLAPRESARSASQARPRHRQRGVSRDGQTNSRSNPPNRTATVNGAWDANTRASRYLAYASG